MKQFKGMCTIGILSALLLLSGCVNPGAAAGSATRSAGRATTAASPTSGATKVAARPAATKGASSTGMTIIHTIQPGENLYRIAREYGTSVQAIAQANGITDVTRITVGQKLVIPNIPATTEPEPTATPTATPSPVPARGTPLVVTVTRPGPTPTIDPNATPTLTPPPPDNVNGVKLDQFVIMSSTVQSNIRQIFAKGQQLGRNPHRFSKIGDSIIEHPHFMVKFDTP